MLSKERKKLEVFIYSFQFVDKTAQHNIIVKDIVYMFFSKKKLLLLAIEFGQQSRKS